MDLDIDKTAVDAKLLLDMGVESVSKTDGTNGLNAPDKRDSNNIVSHSIENIDCEKLAFTEIGNDDKRQYENGNDTENALLGVSSTVRVQPMSRGESLRNLVILSVSFTLLFSAWMSFQNLQSTINKSGGMGTIGLSVLYVTIIFGSLLVAPISLSKFSNKWIIVLSMGAYIVFLATGFYAAWSTIIPGSMVIGMGAAHLWPAKQRYVSELAKRYAVATNSNEGSAMSLFFGIFFCIFFTNQIWGNLMSSLLFQREATNSSNQLERQCGAAFCPFDGTNGTDILPPTKLQMYTYTGSCLGLASVGVISMAIFLPNMPSSNKSSVNIVSILRSVLHHILYSWKQKMLVVTTILRGMSQAFAFGDLTIAFVSCPLGMEYVGFVMIAYGLSSSIFAIVFGRLYKYTGHFFLFVIAFVIQFSVCVTMLFWQPDSSQFALIFLLVGLWSICDAVYVPTVTAVYSLYFKKHKDAAISSLRLLDAIGFSLSFGYSSFLCTNYKVYIIMSVLTVSFICLIIFHIFERKRTVKILEYDVKSTTNTS